MPMFSRLEHRLRGIGGRSLCRPIQTFMPPSQNVPAAAVDLCGRRAWRWRHRGSFFPVHDSAGQDAVGTRTVYGGKRPPRPCKCCPGGPAVVLSTANRTVPGRGALGAFQCAAAEPGGPRLRDGEEVLACEAIGVTPYVPKPLTSGSKAKGRLRQAGLCLLGRRRRSLSLPGRGRP